ncbi:MAG: hypothetical protein EAS51_10035 [Microbacteriaceae bacterium]|nr:MAG: hypothetical protein EAS51_10035 [Microbacteriaceae bacterium]
MAPTADYRIWIPEDREPELALAAERARLSAERARLDAERAAPRSPRTRRPLRRLLLLLRLRRANRPVRAEAH